MWQANEREVSTGNDKKQVFVGGVYSAPNGAGAVHLGQERPEMKNKLCNIHS
jgi:hypothetical protein